MERKIGEIFEFGGEWYQCIEGRCRDCYFSEKSFLCKQFITKDFCTSGIIFKKLEKVGEPIEFSRGLYFQRYQLADSTAFYEGDTRLFFNAPTKTFVYIEIKTKEDMEEKNNAKHSNSEKIGKNLKEFDLEAAKSGKPVCTRDGRKARIICFDVKGSMYPIIALIEESEGEKLCSYMPNGRSYKNEKECIDNLMMLPEKKEGWVNVYRDCDGVNITKDDNIYSSKEAAKASAQVIDRDNYVATTRINWEE